MTQSFRTAPHFYLSLEADMRKLLELRGSMDVEATRRKPTYTDMIVKIVAQVLKEFPGVNSTWTEEGIELKEEIHVGVAVESEAGLVVPVVKNADVKSLFEISEILFQLVQKARDRKLGIEELTGGTFTVTNMGMLGIERFDAIINPPESAILSVGKVVEKAVVIDGGIHIRPRMDLTLSVDHRVLDGSEAARFLVRIKERIEDPAGFR
jgi:pyruvate dehydrogenase E2 component (dihydrolipoamide acetyltransferase)